MSVEQSDTAARCRVVRAEEMYEGKQRASFFAGVSAESVGAKGLCMHLVTIPPGTAGEVHLHEEHETALFMLAGESITYFGEYLTESAVVRAGEFLYIPAGVPHRAENNDPVNPARAVLARTDPNEQESVILLTKDGFRRDDAS